MLSLSRQAWTNVALAAVLAAGVGFYLYRKYRKEEVPDAPPPVAAEELPVEVDAEGWRLRTDCTLVMEPTPTVRVSPAGRFIDTPGVGLVPTNRADWSYMIRPRAGSGEKAVVRLVHGRVPLKVSKQVPGWGDEVFLTENDVLGAPVTTLVIPAGTVIVPPLPAEVVDRLGKVVLRHPAE